MIRSMIGMMSELRRMKAQNLTNNEQRNDLLRRSTWLTVQICILNGGSMLYAAIVAFCICAVLALQLGNFMNGFYLMYFYCGIVQMPMYVALIGGSNIGVIVHYRYSRLYRDAARAVFAQVKQRICCSCLAKLLARNTVVQSDETIDLTESSVGKQLPKLNKTSSV